MKLNKQIEVEVFDVEVSKKTDGFKIRMEADITEEQWNEMFKDSFGRTTLTVEIQGY